jgi:methyl-accepting chemotaxis protein
MPAAASKVAIAEDFNAILDDYKGQVDAIRRSQAVIEFNLDGTIIDANENFLNTLGYTLAEIRGQHHRMFVTPAEQNAPAYRAFWEKLARGEFDAGQYKRIGKGGREVWIEASYNPVFGSDGKPTKVIKFATDITAQKAGVIRTQAMENLFASVMMVDRDLNITYVNSGTKALLTKHAATLRSVWPNFDPNKIVGQCIDQFHKDPSHQRRILNDPSKLPHTAEIAIGPLRITLSITGIFDPDGSYIGNCLEWDDVTERRAQEAVNADYTSQLLAISKSQAVIEFNMDGTIREANANFLSALGYTMDEIRGQHHRMFVDPAEHGSLAYREFWERFARGEANIGQFKRIAKGGRVIWIQASYNPITGADGKVFKVVKYASDVTPQRETAERVKEIANIVSSASSEMRATAEQLSSTAEEATKQAAAVTNAAMVASNNVQTVSAAGEELSASISEIARQVAESTNITQQAVIETDNTKAAIQHLAEAAQKIGNVVTLINNIAGQTKLLALNATIEAARAGDAGKGFAVVASEVKSLSDQTAKATHEISSEVSAMQAATSTSVSAIQGIAETIGKVSSIAMAIASAVEEQSAATGEIATNVTEAASSTQEVSSNIQGLSDGVAQTSAASAQLLTAAGELAHQAEALSSEMDNLTR